MPRPPLEDDEDDVEDVSCLPAVAHAFAGKIAVMIIACPVAWALRINAEEVPPMYHFAANFLTIIPLAWGISVCTEHLEIKVGPTWGTLLNSTFGNVVEMILSVQVIRAGARDPTKKWLFKIVQSSLLGAVLMNLLFVLGCCFFVVGLKQRDTKFNMHSSIYSLCLLSVASLSLVVPTAMATFDEWSTEASRLAFSRGIALCLLAMYVQWLVFTLVSHKAMFDGSEQTELQPVGKTLVLNNLRVKSNGDHVKTIHDDDDGSVGEDEDDDAGPTMPLPVATTILLCFTVLVSFHCDFLVEAINPVTEELHIKKAFVATVVLPLVGNFSEVIAALSIASKGKLDLAMEIAIASATQIAMVVVPVAVLIGWWMDAALDLDFEIYQVHLLIICILVAALMLQDGHANWLKGTMLMTTYFIVAFSFWFISDREFKSAGDKAPVHLSCNMTEGGTVAQCIQIIAAAQPSTR